MKYYIGVDISKYCLDVDWLGEPMTFSNDSVGINKLVKRLRALFKKEELALLLCEASGGYEQKLVCACHKENLPVHLSHANHIKYFAKSHGIKAKTDQIDAKTISAYGRERKPKADSFHLNENTLKIRTLLKRREQLIADKKREKSRIDKIDSDDISTLITSHIEWLDRAIEEIEARLLVLRKTESVEFSYALLTSVPGIGKILAYYLMSNLPELGKLSHKAIAALIGVAPFNHDSGKHQGKRFIQGGRSQLRQMLYMAAMTSIIYNPELKHFYDRLRDAGKPGKVALIAVMRKLLSILNSVMSRGTPWQGDYQNSL